MRADRDNRPAAQATLEQPAEQRLRSRPCAFAASVALRRAHTLAHTIPRRVRYDSQLRTLLDAPFILGAQEALPLPRPKIMEKLVVTQRLRILGWAATTVMAIAVLAMFIQMLV